MKRVLALVLAVITVLAIAGCAKEEQPTFKIGAIPDQDVSELNRKFGAFAEYLAEETGMKVEYVSSADYAALVTAFERGEIQLAWFGGLTSVQARARVEAAESIVQRPRDEEFHTVFIANKALGLTALEDVKGKTLSFGSESSTSGHLMPRHFMLEAGINPDTDLNGTPNYSGSHDKTIKLVEAGSFEVGALNEAVWEKAVKENSVDLTKVDVFYTTPAYFDYNWTINTVDEVYGEGTKEKVKAALLSMDEEQKEILDLFQTDKFVETKNENYDLIKNVAEKLGIIN